MPAGIDGVVVAEVLVSGLTGTVRMLSAGTDAHTWLVEGATVVAATAVASLTRARVAAPSCGTAGQHRGRGRRGCRPLRVPPQPGERADGERPAAQQAHDRPRVGRPVGA